MLFFLLLCALLAGPAGCTIVSPSNSDDNVEFGDPYEIRLTNPSTGEPIAPAIHVGDRLLVVTVSYSGGCEAHEFFLHMNTSSDSASLWLEHDSHGDACEAYITEELQIKVPDRIIRAKTVQLLNPNDGPIAVGRVE